AARGMRSVSRPSRPTEAETRSSSAQKTCWRSTISLKSAAASASGVPGTTSRRTRRSPSRTARSTLTSPPSSRPSSSSSRTAAPDRSVDVPVRWAMGSSPRSRASRWWLVASAGTGWLRTHLSQSRTVSGAGERKALFRPRNGTIRTLSVPSHRRPGRYDRRVSKADDDALNDLTMAVFGPDPSAVGPARAFVRDAVRKWGGETVVDDAVLIASELVTNAIVHAGTPAEVSCALLRDLSGEASAVRVAVADRHPGRAIPALNGGWEDEAVPAEGGKSEFGMPEFGMSERGRGLYLSTQLASSWGVQYTHAIKQVWFVLNLDGELDDHGPTLAPAIVNGAADAGTVRSANGNRNGIADLDDYLALTAEKIKGLLNADGAFVLLAEDGGLDNGLRLRAQTGLPPGMPQVTSPPSAAGRIGLTGLPALYSDLRGPSDHGTPLISALASGGMRSMATAPLTATPGIAG